MSIQFIDHVGNHCIDGARNGSCRLIMIYGGSDQKLHQVLKGFCCAAF